jgi:hypothetical protein
LKYADLLTLLCDLVYDLIIHLCVCLVPRTLLSTSPQGLILSSPPLAMVSCEQAARLQSVFCRWKLAYKPPLAKVHQHQMGDITTVSALTAARMGAVSGEMRRATSTWGIGIRGKSTAKVLTPGQVEVVMWGSGPEVCAMGRGPGSSETGGAMRGIGRKGTAIGYLHLARWKRVCRGSESRPLLWAWDSNVCRWSLV